MSLRLVRCPFCTKRFNVSGVASGTKLRCGGCSSILTVPRFEASAHALKSPRLSYLQISAGLAAGLVLALVLQAMLWPSGAEEVPGPSAVKPLPPPQTHPGTPRSAYVDPLLRAKRDLSTEFGNGFRLYEKKPYLLAFEPSSRVTNALLEDYGNRLGMLYASFRSEFGLDKLDDVLTVVVLLSRESFDNYWSRRGSAMPQQIHGVYDSGTRRIVLYLGYEAPDEVLFHEGAHQLVHHYARRLTGERDLTWMYWFHEGVGTYFEGFRRGPGGEIELDPRVNRTRLPIVKHAMMDPAEQKNFVSLNVLTGVTVDEFWEWFRSGREAEKANLYYAESWAFTYFLRQRGGDYRRTFDDYFQACLSGRGDKETFERLVRRNLGMELAELEREFIEYITSLP